MEARKDPAVYANMEVQNPHTWISRCSLGTHMVRADRDWTYHHAFTPTDAVRTTLFSTPLRHCSLIVPFREKSHTMIMADHEWALEDVLNPACFLDREEPSGVEESMASPDERPNKRTDDEQAFAVHGFDDFNVHAGIDAFAGTLPSAFDQYPLPDSQGTGVAGDDTFASDPLASFAEWYQGPLHGDQQMSTINTASINATQTDVLSTFNNLAEASSLRRGSYAQMIPPAPATPPQRTAMFASHEWANNQGLSLTSSPSMVTDDSYLALPFSTASPVLNGLQFDSPTDRFLAKGMFRSDDDIASLYSGASVELAFSAPPGHLILNGSSQHSQPLQMDLHEFNQSTSFPQHMMGSTAIAFRDNNDNRSLHRHHRSLDACLPLRRANENFSLRNPAPAHDFNPQWLDSLSTPLPVHDDTESLTTGRSPVSSCGTHEEPEKGPSLLPSSNDAGKAALIERARQLYGNVRQRPQREQDEALVAMRKLDLSYKEIKEIGNFAEAIATLRGRHRSATKPSAERVRKPKWLERDIQLLFDAVSRQMQHGKTRKASHISWKNVAEYLSQHGASYKFSYVTCSQKWRELDSPAPMRRGEIRDNRLRRVREI